MPTKVVLCDTPDGLAQLQYVLIKSGAALEVETAADGLRAVEIAARTRPSIVVTEVAMEGLAGAELVRRLLAIAPGTKVICWSEDSPLLAAEMLQAGASAYVSKEEGPDGVFRAMRAVHAGPVALSRQVAGAIAEQLLHETKQVTDLEIALTEVSEQLDALATAKADFLANVSHELRTPVTVAKGIAYVLKNRAMPAHEEQDFIGQLETALEKLSMLIDEMLTVADLDRGELALELSDVDLAPILRHVADEMGRQYPSVDIAAEVPDSLQGAADPLRFAEILRQLLDNACRYSPERGRVSLKARGMDEGVVISVTDRGEGIARETVTRAFEEPFSAGEDILHKERSGAGVGLHLARQLVLQHGGILWADPVPAGGTRVSFVVPARRGEPVSRPALDPEPADPPLDPDWAGSSLDSEPSTPPLRTAQPSSTATSS